MMRQPFTPLPLNAIYMRLALWFAKQPDEHITAKMLSLQCGCDIPNANRVLRSGLEQGWLVRFASTEKRRIGTPEQIYHLSPEALPLFERPLAPHENLDFGG